MHVIQLAVLHTTVHILAQEDGILPIAGCGREPQLSPHPRSLEARQGRQLLAAEPAQQEGQASEL